MADDPATKVEASNPSKEQGALAQPVDLEHLSRYTLGELELEREVLELFCSQSQLYVEQLRAANSETDWRNAAHSLKGSARAIGAWGVAQAAERAEALHGDSLTELRGARIDEIEVSLREAEGYITAVLKNR